MAITNDLTGSGIGRLGKQAKPRFKPIVRRSHSNGVNKAKKDEPAYVKALEAMCLNDIRTTEIASQDVATDDVANRSFASPTIAPNMINKPKNSKKPQKPEGVNFSLMSALPKYDLHFSDKEFKLQLVLGRQWKDAQVICALCKDMPRGEKPHKRFVQPLLIVTFQQATQLVKEGNLGPVEDADALKQMWFGFLKKLRLRIQLKWPTELSFTFFTGFFSALVDARQTAKAVQYSENLEVQEFEELGKELAGLTVNSASCKAQDGKQIQSTIKPPVKARRGQPGELVKTIDKFLDAVIAAGTIWTSVEDGDESE